MLLATASPQRFLVAARRVYMYIPGVAKERIAIYLFVFRNVVYERFKGRYFSMLYNVNCYSDCFTELLSSCVKLMESIYQRFY